MQIPYQLVAALPVPKRHAQMAVALHYAEKRQYPRLKRVPIDDSKSLTIACYGPSLEQTWQTMQRPILSMSGATRWLADRGLIVDYHLDMDPRAHKVKFLDPPVDGVHYLMATVCHPDTWELLRDQKVTVWHTYSAPETYKWVGDIDGEEIVVHGGSTIGLTALHIGGVLGYRHFEIHGMDGSFNDDSRSKRHAGPHYGTKQQDGITWKAGGKTYHTSRIMSNAVAETLNAVENFPVFCVFHGDGLTQALVKEKNLPNVCCADEVDKAERIRQMTAHIYDPAVSRDLVIGQAAEAWDRLTGGPLTDVLLSDMRQVAALNEARRAKAKYNTGSITVEQMAQLRALCIAQQPKTIVEIGTFIGNSTLAMQAEHIYTCDFSNDCLPSSKTITTFPMMKSTAMLSELVRRKVHADLFFFDGRIGVPPSTDVEMIRKLSHSKTIYVMDDYTDMDTKGRQRAQKGIINTKLLLELVGKDYALVEPDVRLGEKSTLAALVPRSLLG